jgi:hypothetical protein
MRVRFEKKRSKYPDLTPGNVYRVIGIEANDYRIMNDAGRPFLYPASLFEIVDPEIPPEWTTSYDHDGARYSYPKALSLPGFFEDYFDGDSKAVATLHQYLTPPHRKHRKVS